MAYGDFKDLTIRTASDKILLDKAFDIAKNPKYGGYQYGLVSMDYKFFDKKSASLARSKILQSETSATSSARATRDESATGNGIKYENISKKELAEELHKPIIRKFKKRKAQ